MNEFILASVLDRNAQLNPLDALYLALIGIAVVFVVLIVLMLVITVMGKIFDSSEKLREKHPEWNEKVQNAKSKIMFWKKADKEAQVAETAVNEYATGTCGDLKLINVEERDAAMIMAIVADSTGIPLNELRFVSIKKVEEEK